MRHRINFIIGLILGFLLAACITDSFSCETAQCRADRGHNAEGAMITSLMSAAIEPYNKRHHPESAKLRTFAEVIVASAVISVATEWFVGRHGRGFNNRDAWQRFGGGAAGAATYQFLTLEHKF